MPAEYYIFFSCSENLGKILGSSFGSVSALIAVLVVVIIIIVVFLRCGRSGRQAYRKWKDGIIIISTKFL